MAQSLFKTLKSRMPSSHLAVIAPEWTLPLLTRMAEVDDVREMPLGHGKVGLGERRRLGQSLRSEAFDQAIVLPNSLKSALVPWFAGIPCRTGWIGELRYGLLNDIRRLNRRHLPLMAQRFNALAYPAHQQERPPVPYPELAVESTDVERVLAQLGLQHSGRPILALCPGAEFGPAKCWPSEHYAALARHHLDAQWQVRLFGSASDTLVCREINERTGGRCEDLSGKTTLEQAVVLLSQSTAVVSNDSGLMHVAAALGKPLVAIYGSTDPGFTPPLSDRARLVSNELECRPCFKRECPKGHLRCLKELVPDRVIHALEQLLK